MITLAKIVFVATIIIYAVTLLTIRNHISRRTVIITFLLNCLSQVYLLLNGIYTYTIAFLVIEATEAAITGIISEHFTELSMRIIQDITRHNVSRHDERQRLIAAIRNAIDNAPGHRVDFDDFWLNNSNNAEGEDINVTAVGYSGDQLGLYMEDGDFWLIEDLSADEMRLCLEQLHDIDE